jgi:hypothetical protein
MRNVLIVSYHTPPRSGVGTMRTRQLITHLPSYGWNVSVVTPKLEGAADDVIQTEYVDSRAALKRILGMESAVSAHSALGAEPAQHGTRRSLRQRAVEIGYYLAGFPDGMIGWFPGGRRALRQLLPGRFDAILSSAPPFTTNLILGSLRLALPWVADFRDLWADTDAYESRIRRFFDVLFEHWSLREATVLTTISKPMAQALKVRHPHTRVEVIPNAFDAADWDRIPFSSQDRCTILYAGTFHGGRRDPSPLFRVLRALLDENAVREDEVQIDIYAPPEPWLLQTIEAARVSNVVRVRGTVSREDVLAAERQADRLLVLLWDGPGSEGTVTGKLFEYLGARRRIIVYGGPKESAVDAILTSTSAGVRCRDEGALRKEVMLAVQEHRAGRIEILGTQAVAPFEAAMLARRFAEVLDSVQRKHVERPALEAEALNDTSAPGI